MNIVLLSGGSGKRLWPLSNDIRSKQFIKLFRKADRNCSIADDDSVSDGYQVGETPDGDEYESMLQRIYGQIKAVAPDSDITVATGHTQVSAIRNQLGEDVGISVEPCRRDTFAAIALATAYLADVRGIAEDEPVVVCPVDPYVGLEYFSALVRLSELAAEGSSKLVLMGIEPTYPSEKYGYIIPESDGDVSMVSMFREKPDAEIAQRYIEQGGLWNGGVFAYKLSYVLDRAEELLGYRDYESLYENYENLEKISFDYAIVEKEPSISVMRFAGEWKDIGTWNTLSESVHVSVIGDGRMNERCSNVHIFNELDVPILAMGMSDVVIAASPEGILVSDKEQSSYIKPFVDEIEGPVMFAEKSWGSYRVIDVDDDEMTIKVTLRPGSRMNYHSHQRRDEVWTVIRGSGRTIVDEMEQPVKPGDVVTMQAGCRHTVIAGDDGLVLIEVQLGEDISVEDKTVYELDG